VQQAADTYRVVKQRTQELQRALRRESLFNTITSAIRESLDYDSMLQTIAATLGRTFGASHCMLHPIESNHLAPEVFVYSAPGYEIQENITSIIKEAESDSLIQGVLQTQEVQSNQALDPIPRLVVPLTDQQDFLAVLSLERSNNQHPWSTEDIELIQSVAAQASLAISQAKLYRRTQEQAEQMRAELEVARQIQGNLLRQSLPELEGMKVQACCYPAREVGGDFFEVYAHPQGDIWLAVGDVSGKGVPAALFMASAISVLRRELSQEMPPEPHIVMQNLNSSLSEDLISTNCFITMVLARYTPASRKLVYANAGHIYPLVWSSRTLMAQAKESGSAPVEPNYLKVRGVPLGILPNWKAASGSMELNPGEVLLLTSDGITEATVASETGNGKGEHLTSSSMLKQTGLWQLLIQEQKPLNLSNLLSRIRSQNTIQEDDQTILSLEVL
jgi:serine phosphatase RsbU (regulator of sigma subunit)